MIRFRLADELFELRIPHHREVPELLEALEESASQLRRFMLWSHLPGTFDKDFQRHRMLAAQAAFLEERDYSFHVWRGLHIVGGAGLHPRSLNPKALEVGYWVRSGWAGRGLATAMVQALAVFNFQVLGNQRLQCFVNKANKASLRVAEKCGFRIEGEFRYWEAQGTDEDRARGFASADSGLMHSILKEDLASLPWYSRAVQETEFVD